MLIAIDTMHAKLQAELLCGLGCGVIGFFLLHLMCPGYVGGYYQTRQYANYLCVWQPGGQVILAAMSGVEGIWLGCFLTVFAVVLQWLAAKRDRTLPLFVVAVAGYLAILWFACCQVAYDMRAWKVHPQLG